MNSTSVLPVTEDDASIARMLESASVPTLMMAMIHMSGDTALLDGAVRPGKAVINEVQGALPASVQAQVRAQALMVVRAYRDRGCTLPPPPSAEQLHRMMSFMVGEEVPRDYVPLMLEELALDGSDAREVPLAALPQAQRERLRVLVIGAGMSGLLAAIRLQEAGIPYVVIEKNADVGGTWYENRYPGCRVDIANHFYSYSFDPNPDWSQFFAEREELFRYFRSVAERHGVLPRIRFATEVTELRLQKDGVTWMASLRDAEGERSEPFGAVISGVGQLNRPQLPDIPGRTEFCGPAFHSAQWPEGLDLAGKRVAVVGSGASAFQLVPELAKQAASLCVFQRSPGWMFPNPDYHRAVSEGTRWCLKHLPGYARWYRFLLFWPGADALLPALVIDPAWPHQERSVNALNEQQREAFVAYIRSQVRDPQLLAKVIPDYPPFGKRMLQDNGSWLAALQKSNVELIASAVSAIGAHSVRAEDGTEREVDAIVFATGFRATRFLWPIEVYGRDGLNLGEHWDDEPSAYLGITVPRFPNLFLLYGPATNLAHAGSIIFNAECQVRYTMGCLKLLLEREAGAIECREDVHAAYHARLRAALKTLVWSHPKVHSWYQNRSGEVVTTSPWRLLDYWNWTREPDPSDYRIE